MNVQKTKCLIRLMIRQLCSSNSLITPKICVVGSGPAGFYAAQYLQKRLNPVEIDIYEKYPVPFGLVRYGVAPDHPNVKNCINTFTRTAECPNVNYYGNVTLGKDVTLKQLRQAYHIVLLSYGASENRRLHIPGEDLEGVFSARRFVGWYNGVPEDANLNVDFRNTSEIVVLGQGNVAVDVARILLSPYNELKLTDIPNYALETLSQARISNVHLVGRRGPIQAAFTTKELREMLKLPGCRTAWQLKDFQEVENLLCQVPKTKKRLVELMLSSTKVVNSGSVNLHKHFKPTFYLSPKEISVNTNSKNRFQIHCTVNELEGDDILRKTVVPTDVSTKIAADLIFVSVGYKSTQVDKDIPFNDTLGVAKNDQGKIDKGLYACGWLSTGPVGVLVSTMHDAFSTADSILKHIESENLIVETKPGYDYIGNILKLKNVQVVTWKDWLKIDEYEKRESEKLNKPREKITSIVKMLEVAS